MSAFEWLKLLHVICAFASLSGFALRGYWKLTIRSSAGVR